LNHFVLDGLFQKWESLLNFRHFATFFVNMVARYSFKLTFASPSSESKSFYEKRHSQEIRQTLQSADNQ